MTFITKVLYLTILFYKYTQSFNIKGFHNLQTIVSTKAITNSITNRFSTEIINENFIISDIMHHNMHIEGDLFCLLLIITSIIYKTSSDDTSINKLQNFEMFSKTQKRTNLYLLILAIVFTRNIDNAI